MSMPRRSALAGVLIVLVAAGAARAQVGVTDGPKGVVVNPRNGKAYAAFPDLGVVKIRRPRRRRDDAEDRRQRQVADAEPEHRAGLRDEPRPRHDLGDRSRERRSSPPR